MFVSIWNFYILLYYQLSIIVLVVYRDEGEKPLP